MPGPYYVKHSATGAANGSSWTDAYTSIAAAAAVDAAGDTIYVSDNHAESNGATQSIALAGTLASPVKVLCADDAAIPPTASATTATATTTGAFGFAFTGTGYVRGIAFTAGSGSSAGSGEANIRMNQSSTSATLVFENCDFILGTTATTQQIVVGSSGDNVAHATRWVNCDVKFANASQNISVRRTFFQWDGGSLLSGGTSPTTLFSASAAHSSCQISGLDLTNAGQSINIFTAGVNGRRVIRNCKLPANWNGSLSTGTFVSGERVEMYNCDSADTNYRIWIEDYAGDLYSETTIVRSGGATDGTTPISWKLVSTPNAEFPLPTFDTPEIVRWNETTGSSITVTVEIVVNNNITLKDDEIWLEVQYLGTSTRPLSTFISDCKSDPIPAGVNQTSSSVTWTTTGMTNPVKQKLSVTFTPQEKGFIHAVVKLARASTTVYVDPLLTVT